METKQYAAAGPWISVEDALPEEGTRTLVAQIVIVEGHLMARWQVSRYMGSAWECELEGHGITVTHWAEVRV